MKKSIYAALFGMGVVALALTMMAALWMYYIEMRSESEVHLRQVTKVLADGMSKSTSPQHWLETAVADLDHSLRITWIDSFGNVRYESSYRAEDMDNHRMRPEIREAELAGEGMSRRDSGTLMRETSYYALRLADGSILRGAIDRSGLAAMYHKMLPTILGIIMLMLILCFYSARELTSRLVRPLREAGDLVTSVVEGKKIPILIGVPELDPILARAREQQESITRYIGQLRKERNTKRLMMDTLKEGVILVDGERKVVDFNRAAEYIFGLTREFLGKDIRTLGADLEWIGKLETDEEKPKEKHTWHHRNQVYQVVVRRTELADTDQSMLIVVRNITADHQMEKQRREFSANVTHELNTPLTSIRGFAELLHSGLYRKENEVHDFSGRILKEADRLLQLIEKVMRLSKIDERTSHDTWQPVSLKRIAEQVAELVEPQREKKDIHLQVTGDTGMVLGDTQLLFELVLNLVDNAIKYNVAKGDVDLRITEQGDTVLLVCRDTGIGIPEKNQPHVFERFYRVEESRSKDTGGSGIGLAIVKHIVQSHQGILELQSSPGEGTVITVRLPAMER